MLLVLLIHVRVTMASSLRKWERYSAAAEAADWERADRLLMLAEQSKRTVARRWARVVRCAAQRGIVI